MIDPRVFLSSSVSNETRSFNEKIISSLKDAPDMWSFPPQVVRDARTEGNGPFPVQPAEPSARVIEIDGKAGPISLRIFKPKEGPAAGVYFHIHGGGWMIGSAEAQDSRLQEIADHCLLTCVSVEYRLAPENPYPAGPDDCETAALWLLNADHGMNTKYLAIGGESAGGHLAVVTLLRLRDLLGHCPFHAANLVAGVFDLGHSASSRNWGDEKLILNSRDMRMFVSNYLQAGEHLRDGDISPLFAKLGGLPPALFSVGTKDLLLDDSLQMATRWHAANGNGELDVTPGGCHVFQNIPELEIARKSNAKIDRFLTETREI